MDKEPLFFIGVPDWLKDADNDVFGAVMTLLTEWEIDGAKNVEKLYTRLTTNFELSDEQAKQAIELMKANGVLKEK